MNFTIRLFVREYCNANTVLHEDFIALAICTETHIHTDSNSALTV